MSLGTNVIASNALVIVNKGEPRMSVITNTRRQHPITSQEAYRLDEQFHGLIVFGLEGLDNKSAAGLALWLSERTPVSNHMHDDDIPCRLWVGTTIPCPREEWHLVEAQLIECTPSSAGILSLQQGGYRIFQIIGYLTDPTDSTDMTSVVLFRGKFTKFTFAGPKASGVESGIGYIKLNLLG